MEYTEVKNPRWNKEQTAIECEVTFEGLGTVPFNATPDDVVEHGREIFARCVAGDFGSVADYAPLPDEGPQPIQTPEGQTEGAQTL